MGANDTEAVTQVLDDFNTLTEVTVNNETGEAEPIPPGNIAQSASAINGIANSRNDIEGAEISSDEVSVRLKYSLALI